eukprot:scaffold201894_cov15-Tisochrysis_lutea.AAC.1
MDLLLPVLRGQKSGAAREPHDLCIHLQPRVSCLPHPDIDGLTRTIGVGCVSCCWANLKAARTSSARALSST